MPTRPPTRMPGCNSATPRGARLPAGRKRLPASLPSRPGAPARAIVRRDQGPHPGDRPVAAFTLGPYLYYTRTTAGDEYPRHYRCPRPADDSNTVDESQEQLLLDPNALANGGFLSLGAFSVSPDHRLLAYSLDTSGDEVYSLYVKDLASGAITALPFEDCDGSMTWANDSQTLFFAELDDTHRPWRLCRHTLGSPVPSACSRPDGRFFLNCYRTSSERQLVLLLNSKTTSEAWVLNAETPQAPFVCLAPRVEGHEYFPDHGQLDGAWCWFIRTNQDGINFALYAPATEVPGREQWQALVPHREAVMLEGLSLNAGALTLSLREGGLPIIEVRPQGLAATVSSCRMPPTACTCKTAWSSPAPPAPALRSTQPPGPGAPAGAGQRRPGGAQANTGTGRVRCRRLCQRTLGRLPPTAPRCRSAWCVAARTWARPCRCTCAATAPGESLDPWFSHARLSLLQRGVAFAIAMYAEVASWAKPGTVPASRRTNNTFSDFIACAEHLVAQGVTAPDRLAISGGSAGGLLIGAVLNLRPELFRCAVAEVPFVDVLNTMLDPDLPLTVTEYDEWGNPEEPEVYARIKAYAPYENVKAQAYPAMLVVAGYNDSRVQYWEAAKWVARLRKTDDNLLLLKTEMGAGHGMSGRYQGLRMWRWSMRSCLANGYRLRLPGALCAFRLKAALIEQYITY